MKKRVLSVLLAIVMVVGMFPVTAGALPAPHTHPVCGKTHTDIGDHTGTCEAVEWTAWNGTTDITYTDGTAYVYLSADVSLSGALVVGANQTLYLCLNDHVLDYNGNSASGAITVRDGGVLYLTDCCTAPTTRYGRWNEANTVYTISTSQPDGGSFDTLTGGVITGGGFSANLSSQTYNGGGVWVYNGTFYMYGGTIAGNTAFGPGGGVYVTNGADGAYGVFYLYDGTITGNRAANGGGLGVFQGEFYMSGGEITGNTATGSTGGGGVYVSESEFHMSGGSITDNRATANGGGVVLSYSNKSKFNMSGGSITGNSAGTNGGGVYAPSSAYITVSGAPKIINNTKGAGDSAPANNLVPESYLRFTVSGTLGTGASIGIFRTAAGRFSAGGADSVSYFSSDNAGYKVEASGKNLTLVSVAVPVTDVSLSESSLTLDVGGTKTLTATVLPDDATDKTVIWTSSDNNVATVENGKVTALTPGSTTITATTTDGGFTATCAVTVSAPAETHSHPICGATCTHDDTHSPAENWTELTASDVSDGTLSLTDGKSYYLGEDITVSASVEISGTVNLCLNGHVLKYDGTGKESVIAVTSGATLTICDCTNTTHTGYINNDGLWTPSGEEAAVTLTGGIITGGTGYRFYDDTSYYRYGGGIYVDGGTLNLYGGNIAGNLCAHEGDLKKYGGGGVYVKNGTFNMYDGTITGNCAMTKTNGGGGGLYLDNSTFNMSGGKISQNKAHLVSGSYGGYGGGIYVFGSNSQVKLSGIAEISGNSAYSNGGGIYLATGSITMSENVAIDGNEAQNGGGVSFKGNTFTINGGSISNNTATGSYGAGGVEVASGSITMNDGSISNNTAAGTGGGVRVYDGTFTMAGGSISGNKTTGSAHGGGVYIYNNGSATFAMTAGKISGNTASGNGGGVYNDKVFQISGGEISGNIASVDGGGVYANKAVKLSGAPTISGNTVNENSNNVSVSTSVNIAVVGELTNTTPIGVTVRSSGTGKFASPSSDVATLANGYANKFQSDNPAYAVAVEDTYLILAEAPHSHDMSVDCGGSGVTFEPWDGTTTFPGGNVYLTKDITLTEELTISGTVNLCLNGHSITNSAIAAIAVNSGATLNICDCKGGGSVTNSGGTNSGSTTYGIYNSGTVNVYGGTISATTTATTTTAGSGIYNYSGQVTVVGTGAVVSGTFYGIYNNSTNGTVSVSAGKVSGKYGIYNKGEVIVGGEIEVTGTDYGISNSGTVSISGGTVQATGSSGHGIYSTGGTVSVSGGTVQATGSNGRGIYNSGGAVSVSDGTVSGLTYGVYASGTGDITISGGKVSAINSASNSNSYGVYRLGSGAVEITGGTVSGKNGVYLYGSGNVTVSGGTVTGNGSGIYGYGIYLHSSSTGAVSVSGGTVSGTAYGVYTTGGSSGSVTVSGVANISGAQSGILHYGKGTVTVSGGTVQSPQRVTGTTSSGIKILTGSGNVTVSGGTVSGMDYGIYNGGTLTLSNAPTITGDTADIHLDSGKIITISGALTYTEENAISVKMDSAGTFTSGWTTNMGGVADKDIENYFTSAVDDYIVAKENNGELWLAKTYTVTYDGNDADSGEVPVDSNSPYVSDKTVTVLGNTGDLEKDGYEFAGWNTKADGTGTAYSPDDTFIITNNTTLYAVWKVPHIHEYTYAVNTENAAQVIESCTCGHKETATLELDTTVSAVYTGSAIKPLKVTCSSGWAGDQNAAISYSNNTNAGTASGSVTIGGLTVTKSFTITKKSAEAPAAPTAQNSITYGAELSEVGLTVGWTWADGNTIPTVNNSGYTAYYTPADVTNLDWTAVDGWNASAGRVERTVAITVNKSAPTYTAPTGLTATYGDTLANVSLPSGWTWKTPSASVGNAGVNSFKAVFTPDDTDNYDTVEIDVIVTVGKADASYTTPTELTATYGDTLADVSLPSGWTWKTPSASVGNVGINSFKAVYTPSDTDNFNAAEVDVSVTVGKANSSYTAPTAKELVYNGSAQTLVNAGSTTTGAMQYALGSATEPTGSWSATLPQGQNAGTYYIWYKVVGDDNHNDVAPACVAVTIAKKQIAKPAADNSTFTYNGNYQTYAMNGDPAFSIANNVQKNAGSYTVTVKLQDTANYEWTDGTTDVLEYTFKIEQREIDIGWDATMFLPYTGNSLLPKATATNLVDGDTCTLTTEVVETTEGAGVIPGEWTAKVTALSNNNYKLPASGVRVIVTFEIVNGYQNYAPVVSGTNETIDGKGDGKIIGVDNTMEYRKEGETSYTAVSGSEVTGLHDGIYYVRYAAKTYYNPSPEAQLTIGAGRKLTVTVPQNQIGYTLITTTPELDYYGSIRVEFKLLPGYSMTENFEIYNGTEPIWQHFNQQTGILELTFVASDFDLTVAGVADISAPVAEIDIKNNKWTNFWNDITFGLFFNETQDVTITAADAGSGVNTIQYYLAGDELEIDEVRAITDWVDYNGTFKIDPNNHYVVYAKITDNAGNTLYINSDGIVLDNIAPTLEGIENGKTYYGDLTVIKSDEQFYDIKMVTLDGEPMGFAEGTYGLIPADNAEHIVVVQDHAGNKTTYTVTVMKNYTVTYKADGIVVGTQIVGHGKDATAPDIPEKEGYTQTAPTWDKESTNITTDTEINAVYTINKYTVTYKADGETVSAVEVEHGKDATAPVIPTKEGYTQTAPAWDKDGKNITADTEINAVYTINEYTITFMDENGVYMTLTVKHGETVTMPEVPAKDGYTVTWDTTIEKATGNATVNAVYTKNAVSDNPQTGDNSNLWLWWILLIVSAFGITVICIEQKKRKSMR